jgi:hypothetical protein
MEDSAAHGEQVLQPPDADKLSGFISHPSAQRAVHLQDRAFYVGEK